jgi:hypothetical protein
MNTKPIANQKLHPKLSTENRINFSEHEQKSSMEETLTAPKNEAIRKERTSTNATSRRRFVGLKSKRNRQAVESYSSFPEMQASGITIKSTCKLKFPASQYDANNKKLLKRERKWAVLATLKY